MYFICAKNHKILLMHAFVTSKNLKWCHLIWPTLYNDVSSTQKITKILSVRQDQLACILVFIVNQNFKFCLTLNRLIALIRLI